MGYTQTYKRGQREKVLQTCKIISFRILVAWQFIPIWIKRNFKECFDTWNVEVVIFDNCDVVVVGSNSLEFVAYKASKIIAASWESWSSELHSTQRLRTLGRHWEIDDSSWELLCGTSKGTRDDMMLDVWNGVGRLFVGDIQDQMIDGNTSRENPS